MRTLGRALIASISLLAVPSAHASLNDCSNLYVGTVLLEKGVVPRVFFTNNPGDASGSYYQWFGNGWTADETKMAISLLTAAKIAGHRVSITTTGPNGCNITTDGYYLQRIYLSAGS